MKAHVGPVSLTFPAPCFNTLCIYLIVTLLKVIFISYGLDFEAGE